jgi:hypothetical protein
MEKTSSFFDYQNSFQLLILVGAFLAAIFLIISPFFIRVGQRRKIYLILFVVSLGMNNLSNYMIDINLHLVHPIIPLLPLPLTLMIPVSCYFYLQTVLDDSYRISAPGKILIFLIVTELAFYLLLMTLYAADKQLISENPSRITKVFQLKEFITIFITFVLAIDIILKFYSRSRPTQSTSKPWQSLAKYIFALSVVIVFSWTVSYVYGFFIDGFSRKVFYPIWCISSFVIGFAGWHAITKKELPNSGRSDLAAGESERILFARLQHVMVSEQLFKKSKLTLKEFPNAAAVSIRVRSRTEMQWRWSD